LESRKKGNYFRSLNPDAFSPLEPSSPPHPVQIARQRLIDIGLHRSGCVEKSQMRTARVRGVMAASTAAR
jgi:hypothetical protein